MIIFTAIFFLAFAWMWERNANAKKMLKRIQFSNVADEDKLEEWKQHTIKRMSRANKAALFISIAPGIGMVPFYGMIAINILGWTALLLAFSSNDSGRKADALAKQIGLEKGLKWLASKKPIRSKKPEKTEQTNPNKEESSALPAQQPRSTNDDYEVVIPEGQDLGGGYIGMHHNVQYSLLLKNRREQRCDADVAIDGIPVGTWRIEANSEINIERPLHDIGHFTFFEIGTLEADASDITEKPDNGLISVCFKPENNMFLASSPSRNRQLRAGATGLTGESSQEFDYAPRINHDKANTFTIHVRLVSKRRAIKSLAPRSTSIPAPLGSDSFYCGVYGRDSAATESKIQKRPISEHPETITDMSGFVPNSVPIQGFFGLYINVNH